MRTLCLTVATVLALGLASSAVKAQPTPSEADIEQAKAAFVEGKALYDSGEKREAVAKFKQSYRLSRNALLLYNIGLTYDELGETDLAIFYYDKFLSDTDEGVANRDVARQRLTALRKEAERKRAAEAERAAALAEAEAELPADETPAPTETVERPDDGMLHRIISDAPPGQPLDVTAVIPEGKAWKATLFFRSAGSAEFEQVVMEPRYRELVGRIPASQMRGTSVQYFIEVRDDLGKLVASSGKKTSPNIVLIDESAQSRFYPDLDGDDEEPDVFAGDRAGRTAETDDARRKQQYLLWGTTGASVVLLIASTGSYFAAATASSDLEAEAVLSRSADCTDKPCGQFGNFASDLESRGKTFETLHTVTLVGGLAVAGVAGYFWYREITGAKTKKATGTKEGRPRDDDNPLAIVPVVGGGIIGGAAAIRF